MKLPQQRWAVSFVVASLLSLLAIELWCRTQLPNYMVDVRKLAQQAPVVFRGRVLGVTPTGENLDQPGRFTGLARFQIDRLYKGRRPAEALLHFSYVDEGAGNGHDCVNLQPNTYWIVFAVQKGDRLELFDDCYGGLSISSRLGPDLIPDGWLAQLEADFLAGLYDSDPTARLVSIQRLGGLGLASSREALHRVIEQGDDVEAKWAVYATLRTGDLSVLPRVKQYLIHGDRKSPEGAMTLELEKISDPAALPDLIAILESAPGELTRMCVLVSLGQKIKDVRAVPSIAAHLADTDRQARYDALDGLRTITNEGACTLMPGWKEADVEPQVARCRAWWEQEGRFKSWTQN